jgi:hypothetical protein
MYFWLLQWSCVPCTTRSKKAFVKFNEYEPYDGTDGVHRPRFPVQPAQADTEHTAGTHSDQLIDFDGALEDAIDQQVLIKLFAY